jgi:hypothetical protein
MCAMPAPLLDNDDFADRPNCPVITDILSDAGGGIINVGAEKRWCCCGRNEVALRLQ